MSREYLSKPALNKGKDKAEALLNECCCEGKALGRLAPALRGAMGALAGTLVRELLVRELLVRELTADLTFELMVELMVELLGRLRPFSGRASALEESL